MDSKKTDKAMCFPFGFPVTAESWDEYRLLDLIGEAYGPKAFESLKMLAHRANLSQRKDEAVGPVLAGRLNALGLMNDVFREIIRIYVDDENPGLAEETLAWFRRHHGSSGVGKASRAFVGSYPPLAVRTEGLSVRSFLDARPDGRPGYFWALLEMTLLSLAVDNRATASLRVIFDDGPLRSRAHYRKLVSGLEGFFNRRPPFSPTGLSLFETLRAPSAAFPDSLEDQLAYILRHWVHFLSGEIRRRLLLARDILMEEDRLRAGGPGPALVLRFPEAEEGFDGEYLEHERYTFDRDWMSNVVLIAKSAYVWLDQLSRRHGREIRRLDQIPDEELNRLAGWGFNGLWLIGIWERSESSRTIKRMMGNPEALASAYSLYDYSVANDLGGEEALGNLKKRAASKGIRLAGDMVPNHTGIYSRWVVEHPDWFIQLSTPPFPAYSFSGDDLSPDGRVGLYIEDSYFSHRDAAVVFKRIDRQTGDVRYIYHGNDGTHMPWNDTAQLNYLMPEVREAVVQTILHVARNFPIIRFDAAMTLTRRHFQRLWFPRPGEGGAIPSRAEQGMTGAEFKRRFGEEFWREVVDRVLQEMPDTLLLAEAFWLMEGYFVRTLGMHRVYNSAFMNMLKMEENANYRQTIKNVLDYSPEILRRFVNFMNNPDERTAVEQFGKGDKYFGVAMMMVTLPGLPMFGHGQIEGFSERYGMEYRRAYWDETVDEDMVRRHEREIFPLIHRRHLFSGVENFAFFDFVTPAGVVNEDVFAYANRAGGERALIAYNNACGTTSGWLRLSVPVNIGRGEEKKYDRKTLARALDIRTDEGCYYVFRDCRQGLEYIRRGGQLAEEGLFLNLSGYQYYAFIDFREIFDNDGTWWKLESHLAGRGVPDMEKVRREVCLQPVLRPFRVLIEDGLAILAADGPMGRTNLWGKMETDLRQLGRGLGEMNLPRLDEKRMTSTIREEFDILGSFEKLILDPDGNLTGNVRPESWSGHMEMTMTGRLPFLWVILRNMGPYLSRAEEPSGSWFDEWLFSDVLEEVLSLDAGFDQAGGEVQLLRAMIHFPNLYTETASGHGRLLFGQMCEDSGLQRLLGINTFEGVEWFSKERMNSLLFWVLYANFFDVLAEKDMGEAEREKELDLVRRGLNMISGAVEGSEYQKERFLRLITRAWPFPRT